MAIADVLALVTDANLAVYGVAATVTRPYPDDTPVVTTAIWETAATETTGADLRRREVRPVLGLRRDEVPTVPRGTLIEAAPLRGGAVQTWRVEGTARVTDAFTYAVVVAEPTL